MQDSQMFFTVVNDIKLPNGMLTGGEDVTPRELNIWPLACHSHFMIFMVLQYIVKPLILVDSHHHHLQIVTYLFSPVVVRLLYYNNSEMVCLDFKVGRFLSSFCFLDFSICSNNLVHILITHQSASNYRTFDKNESLLYF